MKIYWDSDTFGHSFSYTVYYSNDTGGNWTTLASGLTTTSYTWNLSTIYNGTEVILKVQTTDSAGFKSFTVSSSTFTILNPDLAPSKRKRTQGLSSMLALLSIISLIILRQHRKKR